MRTVSIERKSMFISLIIITGLFLIIFRLTNTNGIVKPFWYRFGSKSENIDPVQTLRLKRRYENDDSKPFKPIIEDKKCLEYCQAAQFDFKTFINVNGMKIPDSSKPGDVTLLTQLSANRIPSLQRLILSWEGPISASIYTGNISSAAQLFTSWLQSVHRDNVKIHLVQEHGAWYPVNYMRNIAQDNAMTQYVFMADVDFVVMPNLYAKTMEYIPKFFQSKSSGNNVLVIPAFQVDDANNFPVTKLQIQESWRTKVKPFIYNFSFKDNDPTDYDRWVKTDDMFEMPYKLRCEAYFVVENSLCPSYDEMLLQRWNDKVSQILEMYSRGFHFWMYPHGYMVHLPHERVSGDVLVSSRHCADVYFNQYFRKRMKKVQSDHRVKAI